MKQLCNFAIVAIFSVMMFGCEKRDVGPGAKVELYLLDTYTKLDHSFQIDEGNIKLQSVPLIHYEDFISYHPANYSFELSDRATNAIKEMEHSVHGVAFALKANESLVYTGYFWPSYSSASCNWLVIDPMDVSMGNTVTVSLGYPGRIDGDQVPDRRNDSRIIEIFNKDNKLAD